MGNALDTFWSFISLFKFLMVFLIVQSFLVNLPPVSIFGVNLSFASQALFGTSRYFSLVLTYLLLVIFIVFVTFNTAKGASKIVSFIQGFLDQAFEE